jgi:ABC-2 type transport system ATP-binding protein
MIKANALTRLYGDALAVDKVSFEIGPREIVGLLGHNGAGKTTIMKMITGFLEPSSGEVTVEGLDTVTERAAVQKLLGYLPENCPLYPEMSVLEYLEYAASLRGVPEDKKWQRIGFAIEKTKLASVAQKSINQLSRGFRQRLGVAQAVLNEPRLLILDEPTNGLDPSQILEMRSLIRELAETATIVISTHIMQEVQAVCSRVIIINAGKVAMDANLKELQSADRIYVVFNKEMKNLESLLANGGDCKVISYKKSDEQHSYILKPNKLPASDAVPIVTRLLVENGAGIYAIHPVVRDLETIFGEITLGTKPNKNGKGDIEKAEEGEPALYED